MKTARRHTLRAPHNALLFVVAEVYNDPPRGSTSLCIEQNYISGGDSPPDIVLKAINT